MTNLNLPHVTSDLLRNRPDQFSATINKLIDYRNKNGDGAGGVAKPGSITNIYIAEGAIASNNLEDGSVTSGKIADGAVTSAKLNNGAVNKDKLANGSIINTKLADSAVTNAKIMDGAVGVSKLIWSELLNKIYPVGSIYISATLDTAAKVGSALGGTWTAEAQGRFIAGVNPTDTDFSTVNKISGSKTHAHTTGNHTLTISEIPSHNHYMGDDVMFASSTGMGSVAGAMNKVSFDGKYTNSSGGDGAHNHGDTGSSSSLPPYITMYIWRRTA